MLDVHMHCTAKARACSKILRDLSLESGDYYLATVHRQENTDDPSRLSGILDALAAISAYGRPVVVPLHPRTRKSLETSSIRTEPDSKLNFIDPVGYLDMIQLEANAALIFTDSGGVQKEAYFAGVPCVTLRNETEWVETVEAGVNFLAGAQTDSILAAFERARTVDVQLKAGLYGDGHASEAILDIILKMT
jgi:UDP-N-acetylglucosamine 2-epimerase